MMLDLFLMLMLILSTSPISYFLFSEMFVKMDVVSTRIPAVTAEKKT